MSITVSFTVRKTPVHAGTWGGNAWMGGTWNGDGYDIRFKYDPDLVDMLKTVIPASSRKWDPQGKFWSADAIFSKRFADACRQEGHKVVGFGPGAAGGMPRLPPPPPAPVISWADVLLARCGTPELRDRVFKNLAKALHADIGGDGQLMQELNDARASYNRQENIQ